MGGDADASARVRLAPSWKARIGEPERVRVEVLMPTKARRRRIK